MDFSDEFKEAFELFDKDQDGFISATEFATVVRSLGINPTEAELSEMISIVSGTDKIDFNSFSTIMNGDMRSNDTIDDLIKAFKVFDKNNTGYINQVELKHVMTTLGEVLTPDEVADMIKKSSPNSNGQINYLAFSKMIFEK